MFKNRSKVLFVCALLATIYIIYLISYFGNSMDKVEGAIATALVTPHIFVIGIGTTFSWVGFIFRKSWAALTGAILYCAGALLFIMYAFYCIPMIVLGFIGYTKQKKLLIK